MGARPRSEMTPRPGSTPRTRCGVPLTSMLAIVAAALCWAEALVVVKAFSRRYSPQR